MKNESEKRVERLQIPVTAAEKARIERAAELSEMTLSEWVRFVLRQRLKGEMSK
ncbi:hypothetical protein IJI69_00270 [Candidatus Saccharibacteria bacterium]|nr:hypothetical protein [Candidatus Saccharibacteria bacterium]